MTAPAAPRLRRRGRHPARWSATWRCPGVPGEIALITLDNGHDHTRPSTFGPAGLQSLSDALDAIEAHRPRVSAVAVTGKPFVFAVGADISGVGADHRPGAGAGHRPDRPPGASAGSRSLDVPTFAFVNGAVLGGGLELALHCDYRTLSSSAAAIAFPECFLGLVPGWGGTQLLPNLIGPADAVKVIIENALNQNKMLRPAAGPPARHLRRAAGLRRLPGRVAALGGQGAGRLHPDPAAGAGPRAGLGRGGRRPAGRSPTPGCTARRRRPYRALELIELAKTADFATGTAAEDEALADLIMSEELRSGLYAFDLVNKRAKRPAGAPDKSLARQGDQGRHRRGRPDGRPAGAAVRPPAARCRWCSPTSTRPAGQGRRLRPLRTGPAAGQGPAQPGQGQPAQGRWSPAR